MYKIDVKPSKSVYFFFIALVFSFHLTTFLVLALIMKYFGMTLEIKGWLVVAVAEIIACTVTGGAVCLFAMAISDQLVKKFKKNDSADQTKY